MTTTRHHPGPAGSDTTITGQAGRSDRTRGKVPRSRVGLTWVAVVATAFVFLLLLIFILQNGQRTEVSFLGAHGHLPMGVALLLAAVFGVLLAGLPGTIRMIQLRALGRRRGGTPPVRPPDAPP